MRPFQILSLGTELVDELCFCLIIKPAYMRLYGWFLSFPVPLSLSLSPSPTLPHYFTFSLFSSFFALTYCFTVIDLNAISVQSFFCISFLIWTSTLTRSLFLDCTYPSFFRSFIINCSFPSFPPSFHFPFLWCPSSNTVLLSLTLMFSSYLSFLTFFLSLLWPFSLCYLLPLWSLSLCFSFMRSSLPPSFSFFDGIFNLIFLILPLFFIILLLCLSLSSSFPIFSGRSLWIHTFMLSPFIINVSSLMWLLF